MRLRPTEFLLVVMLSLVGAVTALGKSFQLHGVTVELEDVTLEVDVFYRSMRFNRAAGTWNVEVLLSNKSSRVLSGPLLYYVAGFTNTSGPLQPDGLDGAQPFFDVSATVGDGDLSPGELSQPYTLSLGVTSGSPALTNRIFARGPPAPGAALAFTRTLDELGQALPSVLITETGPLGSTNLQSDPVFGVVTLGQGARQHVWRFSAPDHLPVWRMQNLTTDAVQIVSYPRLTRRGANVESLTPMAGGTVTNADGTVRVQFAPGTVVPGTTATVTPLNGQSLPALLPLGWSPLHAFWLETSAAPLAPATAVFNFSSPITPADAVALARWDEINLQWNAVQVLSGTGHSLTSSVATSGAYALVVGDTMPTAPPAPQLGQALLAVSATLPNPTNLLASGTVTPATSAASRTPELVTAQAEVVLTHRAGPLPSGVLLHCDIADSYQLNDGSTRFPPRYDHFIVGYQRPGDTNAATLHAQFPLRPLLLFGPDELTEATVHVDVLAPGAFTGSVLEPDGGQVAREALRVLSGVGDFAKPHAAQLRRLSPTNFVELVDTNFTVLDAFELAVDGLNTGRSLRVQLAGAPTNALFVLGRVRVENGLYGIEPRERLASDERGNLITLEPATGDRLPGLTTAGQYVLLQARDRQALITGLARNAGGQAAGGLAIRSFPWLTLSAANGAYQLLAPTGTVSVSTLDLASGDSGQASVVVTNAQTTAIADLSTVAIGPQVVSITPTNGATRVSRVTPVIVRFNKPINTASAINGNQLLGVSNQPVAATLTFNLAGTEMTMLPINPLAANTAHSILISTNMADATGRRLEGANQFAFTTENDALVRRAAEVVIHEPTNGLVRVTGGSGMAEPTSPVILENLTSGATATVLSKPDGSFDNFLEGDVNDDIRVVIVNQNGARNAFAPSRQIFRDGSVGLFSGGGTIEVQDAIGNASLAIEPGAIADKTRIKLEMVGSNALVALTSNTPPEQGKLLGRALRVSGGGSPVVGRADVAFDVSLAELQQLGLPPGVDPTNATYALVAITRFEGAATYLLLNKLEYENGKLVTHSPPFPGSEFLMEPMNEGLQAAVNGFSIAALPASLLFGPLDFLLAPLVLAFQSQPILLTGAVVELSRDSQGQRIATPLPGAIVTSRPYSRTLAGGRPGRLDPGQIYTIAQKRGVYALTQPRLFVNPLDPLDSSDYVLSAMHPRLFGKEVFKLASPPTINLSVTDLIFQVTEAERQMLVNQPPGVAINHVPLYPPAGTNTLITLTMTHPSGAPELDDLTVESVVPLPPETIVSLTDVHIGTRTNEEVSVQVSRERFTVSCDRAALVTLKLKVATIGVAPAIVHYTIPFGQTPPADGNPVRSDKGDKAGPRVVLSEPATSALAVDPARSIRLVFNEPLDRNTVTRDSLSLNPEAGIPMLQFSDDQRELLIHFSALQPNTPYILRFGFNVTDLPPNSNPFDQNQTTINHEPFELGFTTAVQPQVVLPDVVNGGGVVVRGSYAFVLDRLAGNGDGLLRVFDVSDPANPSAAGNHIIPGTPRDLMLIPAYSFKRRADGDVETKDLLAVSFGNIGASFDGRNFVGGGQFIRIFDISQPTAPANLVTRQVTLSPATVIPRLRWSAPMLAYLENADNLQAVGIINVQTMILAEFMTSQEFNASAGSPGADLNGDGDFVDAGEELPSPDGRSPDFSGKVFSFATSDTTQRIRDFNYNYGSGYVGVVLGSGVTKNLIGQPTSTNLAPCYRTLFSGNLTLPRAQASLDFANSDPKRLFNLVGVLLSVSNAPPRAFDMAFVSVNSNSVAATLEVLDITDPTLPTRLTSIPLEAQDGLVQSVQLRADGLLLIAGSQNVLVVDPNRLGESPVEGVRHPAILTRLASLGSGAFSFGVEDYGVVAESLGTKSRLVQTPPRLEFVSFPEVAPFNPAGVVGQDAVVKDLLNRRAVLDALGPARFQGIPNVAASTLVPPSPAVHYYVLIRAPGGDVNNNGVIDVLLESLNDHGHPYRNKGAGFPSVRAAAEGTLTALGQTPRADCDAPVRPLTAWRLSNDKRSPYYNFYLSKPFALTYESITKGELLSLQGALDREIIWSGHFVRASLDTTASGLSAIGGYASSVDVDRKITRTGVFVTAETLPADYIMGPNPPPVTGYAVVPNTFGTVSAHNSELRLDTVDSVLPSRRMPIAFRRHAGAQDLYEGPFGRGWDFNYNQRLVEIRSEFMDTNSGVPLIMRGVEDEIGRRNDVLFHPGDGRTLLYRYGGTNAPPGIDTDPLIAANELGWVNTATAYYLPPEGRFDFIVRFADGRFARLEPDGTQYWYHPSGRLDRLYDRYTDNYHELSYNERGELVRITDRSVTSPRFLEIGYWRTQEEIADASLDRATSAQELSKLGKISRLKDYTGRDLLFDYTPCGELYVREGINVVTAFTGGETGRARTEYLRPSQPKEQANDLGGVVAASPSGTRLFAATGFGGDPKVPVVEAGESAVGPVSVNMAHANTAAAVASGNAKTTVTGADGAVSEVAFDSDGLAKEMKYTGYNAPAASVKYDYTNGLMSKITQPEGNTITYTYDVSNAVLRSRGNLIAMKRDKGVRPGPVIPEATFIYESKYNLPFGNHVDFIGNQIIYGLNAAGKDIGTISYQPGQGISAVGGSEVFTHNSFGQLETHTTVEGFETTFGYDPATGFKISETPKDTATTSFEYEPHSSRDGDLGLPTRIHLPVGAPILMTYNEREELVRMEQAGKRLEERGYDLNGRLLRRSVRLDGQDTRLVETRGYLQNGFLTNVTQLAIETAGSSRDLSYDFIPDQVFRVSEIRHPIPPGGGPRVITKFEDFDHLGRHHKVTEGAYSETYTYDLNGNLLEVARSGATESFEYDGFDRLRFMRKQGQSGTEQVENTYYANDELASTSVRDGQQTLIAQREFSIDAVGRVTEERIVSDNGVSTNHHTFNGLVTTTTDSAGEVTTITLDGAGRTRLITDSTRSVEHTYDAGGNLLTIKSTENATDYTTYFEDYNDLNQFQRLGDDVGVISILSLRFDDVLASVTDARGGQTRFNPSKLGEPQSRIKPNGIEFHYAYDEHRRLASVQDRAGLGHGYQFDDTMRMAQQSFRSGPPATATAFDARHRQPSVRTIPGGNEALGYDAQGRLTSRSVTFSSTGTRHETYTRDPLGRIVGATFPGGAATYEFDKLGPRRRATFQQRGRIHEVVTEIRSDGARTSLEYPAPGSVNVVEARDTAGRLQGVTVDGEAIVLSTAYSAANLVGSQLLGQNVLRCDNEYDLRKRLTARRYTSIASGRVLAEVRYVYDATDNIVSRQSVHRAGRTDFYTYDSGHRLLRADFGVRPQITPPGSRADYTGFAVPVEVTGAWAPGFFGRAYGYDGGGLDVFNGVTEINPDLLAPANFARLYGAPDGFLQMSVIDGLLRPSDELGSATRNRLFIRPAGTNVHVPVNASLTYNGLRQLTRIDRDDGVSLNYHYQHDGLKFFREILGSGISGTNSTGFVYDGQLLVAEYDRQGAAADVRARYYYADTDVPVAADLSDGGGILRRYFVMTDALGSVIGLVDTNGVLVERYFYDAWGQPEIQTPDTTAPRIRRILTAPDGNGLIVEFTELVLPVLQGTLTGNLRASYRDLSGAFQLDDGTPPLLTPTVVYEETLPGFNFGTTLRLLPGVAISGAFTLTFESGQVSDEWNNNNTAQNVSFTFNPAPGAVLFTDPDTTNTDSPMLARSAFGNPFLFHGQYFDYDASLIYLRARFYDPASGLFLQQDPEGYEDSVNLYAGFGQNPVTYRDPSGRTKAPPKVLALLDEVDSILTRQSNLKAVQSINKGESQLALQEEIRIQRTLVESELSAAREVRIAGRPPARVGDVRVRPPQTRSQTLPMTTAPRPAPGNPAAPGKATTKGESGMTSKSIDQAAPANMRSQPQTPPELRNLNPEDYVILQHGTTTARANRLRDIPPDPNFLEKGGTAAGDFSFAVRGGSTQFGKPESYALNKAAKFVGEGGAAILEVRVPKSLIGSQIKSDAELMANVRGKSLHRPGKAMHQGAEVTFSAEHGLPDLQRLWPFLPKRIVPVKP